MKISSFHLLSFFSSTSSPSSLPIVIEFCPQTGPAEGVGSVGSTTHPKFNAKTAEPYSDLAVVSRVSP